MIWRILPATSHDVSDLCCFMRGSDVEEITFNARATGRWGSAWTIRSELVATIRDTQAWSIWRGDDLVALGGIAPDPANPRRGAIWMLGTDLADTHWRGMTRTVRQFIAAFGADFPDGIGNIIPAHMSGRVAWMQHLGFDITNFKAHDGFKGHVLAWMQPPFRP